MLKYTPEQTRPVFEDIMENPDGFLYLTAKYCSLERFKEVKAGMRALGIPEHKLNISFEEAKNYPGHRSTRKR